MSRSKVFYVVDSQKLVELINQVSDSDSFKEFMKGIRFGRAKLISIIQNGRIPEYLGNKLINLLETDDFILEVEVIDNEQHSRIPFSMYKAII